MSEFSVIGSGALICSGKCSYCSATSVQECDYEGKNIKKEDFGKIIWDWDGLKKTFDTNPIIQEAIQKGQVLTLNWWAAEPLDFYQDAEKYWSWVEKTYPNLKFVTFISTNGIPLARKKVVEWVYKMHERWGLTLQLSHDGVGQRIRTRNFDPLYSPSTKDVIVKLAQDGILTMINATLNQFNCSPMANFAYFQKWRYENHLENTDLNLIKLNHNNDAEYTGPFRLRGENLDRYMHEMEILWMNSYVAPNEDPYWKPYKGYFTNQMTRWELKGNNEGGCEAFSKGHKDWTWCCNTKGEYVFCQLCSDPETNPNPNCEQSEACKDCEFREYNDCHPCPDMVQSKECHYKKAYIRTVLRMKDFCKIVDGQRSRIAQLEAELRGQQQSCNCNRPQQGNGNPSMYVPGRQLDSYR